MVPSENPTQIWPRYYTVVEKHEQNKRGGGKGAIVVQKDGSQMRCWREARSGWITHVNEALRQQLCALHGCFSHSCFCCIACGTCNLNPPPRPPLCLSEGNNVPVKGRRPSWGLWRLSCSSAVLFPYEHKEGICHATASSLL